MTVTISATSLKYPVPSYIVRRIGVANGSEEQPSKPQAQVAFQVIISNVSPVERYHAIVNESPGDISSAIPRDGGLVSSLVGKCLAISEIRNAIFKIAPTDGKVLITGETGTGKELAARDIHRFSKRSDKPFIPINCAAIPKETIESVLFGHEEGAFTGAIKERDGIFGAANGGTLFLDELGELEPKLQAKLARVLDDGVFRRVGGSKDVKVDVRVIAATNRDLVKALIAKEILPGLYYRLNTFSIHMPPLRERSEDIRSIAKHLVSKHRNFVPDKLVTNISEEVFGRLENYNWTGNVRELENVIRRAIVFAKGSTIQENDIALTNDEAARKILDNIEDVAFSNATVLVVGETGTGKELIARYIYNNSSRNQKPIVVVNCAAINNCLAESELFGHTQGAFTGAKKAHKGLFEEANGATIFLDGVEQLDLEVQKKLLRVLQEGEIIAMGTNEPKKVNVRVVASTSQDLSEAVKKGNFREDLYHRLSIIPIAIPPLRERVDEIPALAEQFLAELKGEKIIPGISQEAIRKLTAFDWPGNVRELKSVIERAIVFADENKPIEAKHIILNSIEVKSQKDVKPIKDSSKLADPKVKSPFLQKLLAELSQYSISEEVFDDTKLKSIALKCRIVQMIEDKGYKLVSESEIAEKLAWSRQTVTSMAKKAGFGSTQLLVAELLKESTIVDKKTETPLAESPLHPALSRHILELTEYSCNKNELDFLKLKFLAIQCRVLKMIIDGGNKELSEIEIAEKLQIGRSTLQSIGKKFNYSSTSKLVSSLMSEVKSEA